jgi:ribosomal protein S16
LYYIIKLKPIYLKHKIVFKIEVHKKLSNNSSRLVARLGYFDTNKKKKKLFLNSERLGF